MIFRIAKKEKKGIMKRVRKHNLCNMAANQIPKSVEELETSEWGRQASDSSKREEILSKSESLIHSLQKKHGAVAQKAQKALELYRNGASLGSALMTPRNLLVMGAALLYFISPLDCIPDFLPVIGWLDDVGVLAMASAFVMGGCRKNGDDVTASGAAAAEGEMAQPVLANMVNAGVASCEMSPLSKELEDLEREAEALGNAQFVSQISELRIDVADNLKRVVFTGSFNTGKSSLINAILGQRYLPVKATPCTPILTNLLYGDAPMAVLEHRDGTQEILDDVSLIEDTESALMRDSREMTLMVPSPLLKNGITFIDTCGLQDSVHEMIPYEEMPHSAAFVFVKSADVGSLNSDEHAFFSQVASHITAGQIIVVLNKVDLVGSEVANGIRCDLQREFDAMGLSGVRIFCVSANQPDRFEFNDFKREIETRAARSLPGMLESGKQKAVQELRGRIGEASRAKQEMEALSAAERQRCMLAVQHKAELRIRHIKDRAEIVLENFNNALRAHVRGNLLPHVFEMADTQPLNDAFAASVMEYIRNSLSQFLKGAAEVASQSLEVELRASDVAKMATPAGSVIPNNPKVNEKLVNTLSEFVLPGIAIAAFFPMGIFAWLTTIAAPTFVMDKLGVSKGIASIIKNFGPGRQAREAFKQEVEAQLDSAAVQIEQRMAELVNGMLEKRTRMELKSLPEC